MDLATPQGVAELYERLAGRPVDALVLNAGVGVSGDFARGTDLQEELDLISLNVLSPVHLTKLVVQDMVERGEGRIMFTSSIAAEAPEPFLAVYGASKAFVQSFALALRDELKDTGVTVTSLQPGATETNFFVRAGMQDTKVGAGDKDDAADVAKAGFEAMMAGKDHVVTGVKNKLTSLLSKVMPEKLNAAMARRENEPGTAP